jgi:hypothetical protein
MKGIVAYETPASSSRRARGPSPSRMRRTAQFRAAGRVQEADEVSDPDGVRRLHRYAPDLENLSRSGEDLLRYRQPSRRRLRGLAAPDAGLRGNTHIAFADLNNEAVADELSKWLGRKGLDKFAAE